VGRTPNGKFGKQAYLIEKSKTPPTDIVFLLLLFIIIFRVLLINALRAMVKETKSSSFALEITTF